MRQSGYVLITPAKNEEAYIDKTIQSVIAQTALPQRWVIVNDGSTDGTENIIKKYLPDHDFIRLLSIAPRRERSFGAKARAIQAGFQQLNGMQYGYFGNLDADVSLQPHYYANMMSEFERNPKLGIAGGIILEEQNGRFASRYATTDQHVAGAVQFFRRACYEGVGGYLQLKYGGMDAIAIEMARMRGWEVRAFPALEVLHYRRTGTANANIYGGRISEGKEDYCLGYHPLFFAAKCLYRVMESPYLIGSLLRFYGYCWSYLKQEKRELPLEVIDYMRQKQIQRVLGYLPIFQQKRC